MNKSKNIFIVILSLALLVSIIYIFTQTKEDAGTTQNKSDTNFRTVFYQDLDKANDDISH